VNARKPTAAALAAMLLIGAAAPAASPKPSGAISIVINGDRLPIDPPPLMRNDLLFVPVRRTLAALGLPFEISGKQIATQIGSRSVSLTIGSRIATIDGAPLQLDAPTIEIKNVLYAPLRFFTDALGAQARFDRRANTVSIVAQLIGRTAASLVSVRGGYERAGTVAAVDVLSNPPTLTLGYASGPKIVPISPNAIVEMQDVNANVTTPGELGDVRPGDFARIDLQKNGRVERVVDLFGSRYGRIVAVAGKQCVLDDGQVIEAGRTTEVALNGKAAAFSDLRPGDVVSVRYNVETNEVREVLASRAAASPAPSGAPALSVSDDATGPLRAGETLRVVLHGPPNGAATFAIGSYVTNQAMAQSTPGTYEGSYTIPRGASFAAVPVIGQLSLPGQPVLQASAAEPLSASGTPPGIADFAPGEGAVINTSRPAVYAAFAAGAVAVDPSSATLWIDGRDVTSECLRTAQFIQYLPSYSYRDGAVRVTVQVADRAGNVTRKSWTFAIKTR
jgi:hypothetical protein